MKASHLFNIDRLYRSFIWLTSLFPVFLHVLLTSCIKMNMQTIPPDTSILNVNSQNNKILRAFGEMSKGNL